MCRAEPGNPEVGHVLKLPLILGSDRKLGLIADAFGGLASGQIEQGHLADQMIERRAQVVDAVAEDDPEAQRKVLADLKSLDPFPGVLIEITDREIGLRRRVEEDVQLGTEFVELLLAPVELLDHPCEPVAPV
jgi:hypothetical protein